jgi:hypothetical protein
MKKIRTNFAIWLMACLLTLPGLLGTTMACTFPQGEQPSADTDSGSRLMVLGQKPTWDLEEMVERSDAVVIGTLTRDLGDKILTIGEPGDPDFDFVFKDYELTLERSIYPESGFPDTVAVLIEDGVRSLGDSAVSQRPGNPVFDLDEKMLLFLESLEGPEFEEGAGRPVPKGFITKTYYQAIIAGSYGKLSEDGDKWTDAVSGETITIEQLESAIAEAKSVSE